VKLIGDQKVRLFMTAPPAIVSIEGNTICMRFKTHFPAALFFAGILAFAPDTSFARGGVVAATLEGFTAAAPSRSTNQCVRPRAKLSNGTLRSIFKKYGASSRDFGVGKFLPSVTQDSLREMISEVVANGHARPSTHGPFGTLYEYEFPSDIGRSTFGIPTRWLPVIVGPNGDVATAYPD
jgi:hypothetical protein